MKICDKRNYSQMSDLVIAALLGYNYGKKIEDPGKTKIILDFQS